MFARGVLRFTSSGQVRSDGQYRQMAMQSGVFGRTAYALDVDYQHNNGVRANKDLDRLELYTQLKQQLTDADTVLLLLKFEDYDAGDNFQYQYPTNLRPSFRFTEHQHPIAYGLWRHDWSFGFQTLAAVSRLANEQHFSDSQTSN
ncbi:MAG: hypothetical protein EXS36_09040 [Pedosphaera sp.]|nr:hypothetical protein [Pedosphaera sp.]